MTGLADALMMTGLRYGSMEARRGQGTGPGRSAGRPIWRPPIQPAILGRWFHLSIPARAWSPTTNCTPRAVDFVLLQSWLTRAYPVGQVGFSQSTATLNFKPVFDNTTSDCSQANAQLTAMRASDLDAGADARAHYIGLVSSQGGFMRGCAPKFPNPVASGPAGSPTGANTPANAVGDADASFADWYGGHELGHTFGRSHPGFCNGNTKDDLDFPYPNGQISDATEKSFAGLDVGDTTNGIPLAVLWGSTTFDIMTYCNQPDWPSAYTYGAIRQQLLLENPGFKLQEPVTAMVIGPSLYVVGTLNLTKRSGSISYVTPVQRAPLSPAPSSRAELVLRDATDNELFRQSVLIQEMTDTLPGEDQLALIAATIPFREEMAHIELELDGTVIAQFRNPTTTPPAISGVRIGRDSPGAGSTVTWNTPPAAAGGVTYTAQIPGGANSWLTIAVGLAEPKMMLYADQAATETLRIFTSNGFRSSPPVLIQICPDLLDRVAASQADIETFLEALTNGEIPIPIAQAQAHLRALQRTLSVAQAELFRCQANNP